MANSLDTFAARDLDRNINAPIDTWYFNWKRIEVLRDTWYYQKVY
jgi:hypothetical protein